MSFKDFQHRGDAVVANGQLTLDEGVYTGARGGQALRLACARP